MSQHITTCIARLPDGGTAPVRVIVGWDSPTQGYFMDIVDLRRAPQADDRVVYTNLDEPVASAFPRTLAPFIDVLARFGLQLPPRMREELEADAAGNVGNRVLQYAIEI